MKCAALIEILGHPFEAQHGSLVLRLSEGEFRRIVAQSKTTTVQDNVQEFWIALCCKTRTGPQDDKQDGGSQERTESNEESEAREQQEKEQPPFNAEDEQGAVQRTIDRIDSLKHR